MMRKLHHPITVFIVIVLAVIGIGVGVVVTATGQRVYGPSWGRFTVAFRESSIASVDKAGFVPSRLARAGTSSTVFVLGTSPCGNQLCPSLWRGYEAGGLSGHFVKVTVPPLAISKLYGLDQLVFANAKDGYAFQSYGQAADAPVFATVDGVRSWHRVSFGPGVGAFDIAAARGEFFAVLVRCSWGTASSPSQCHDYRLGRSRAGSTLWSSVPIPGATTLVNNAVSLAATGSQVWLSYQVDRQGAVPQLLESAGGHLPFVRLARWALYGVQPCALYPMTSTVLWALCGTGMQESVLRSTNAGRSFAGVWTTFPTVGSLFTPVTAKVAYRYEGVGSKTPQVLERTTDGGSHFRVVAPFPFVGGAGEQFFFLDPNDAYAIGSVKHGKSQTEPTLLFTDDGEVSWHQVVL